jgi:hypothetical protein
MQPITDDSTAESGLKYQFDALVAEYSAVMNALAYQKQMQSQLDNVALTALGLSVPLFLVILERNTAAIGAMLSLPILFFAIAFIQLRLDRQISLDTVFLDTVLRPVMDRVLSRLTAEDVTVILREDYLARHYMPSNFFVQWIATMSRASIGLGVGLGIISITIYVQLALLNLTWNSYESWLLLCSFGLLSVNSYIGVYSARLGYNHYTNKRRTMNSSTLKEGS